MRAPRHRFLEGVKIWRAEQMDDHKSNSCCNQFSWGVHDELGAAAKTRAADKNVHDSEEQSSLDWGAFSHLFCCIVRLEPQIFSPHLHLICQNDKVKTEFYFFSSIFFNTKAQTLEDGLLSSD